MTLEEFKAQATEDEAIWSDAEIEAEDPEDDDEEWDAEADLTTALNLLGEAMDILGYYGDRKMTRVVTNDDRRHMRSHAEKIAEFLNDFTWEDQDKP